jgi:hypothetical protein
MIITAYHGTVRLFTKFQACPSGIHFGTLNQASHRCSWLAARMNPRQYERLPLLAGGQPGYIIRAELRIDRYETVEDLRTNAAWARAINSARAEGFDALRYLNAYEMPSEQAHSWIVFDTAQVINMEFPFNRPEDLPRHLPSHCRNPLLNKAHFHRLGDHHASLRDSAA